jgi:hypothetical protein
LTAAERRGIQRGVSGGELVSSLVAEGIRSSGSSEKEEGKHKSEAQAKKRTGTTENKTNTKILGFVDLE